MAVSYLACDRFPLGRLAALIDRVAAGAAKGWEFAEIRHLEDRFGLSPTARRRLQWEVEHAPLAAVPDPTLDDDEERFLRAVRD